LMLSVSFDSPAHPSNSTIEMAFETQTLG